jgi:hypothetical protein
MQEYEVEYKRALANISTEVTVVYNQPLPPEAYGEDYPSQELEIRWRTGGAGGATVSYVNVISKGEYYISMQAHMDIKEAMGSIDRFKAIFKTIDLEP